MPKNCNNSAVTSDKTVVKKKRTINKRKTKYTRKSVLKMLAVMANNSGNDGESSKPGDQDVEHFLQSGRTGRRNALPNILNSDHVHVTSSDLPNRLEGLSTQDQSQQTQDTSKSSDNNSATNP